MGMNIKNEEAHKLAQELAAITGESITTSVTTALRERLERLRAIPTGNLSERMVKIGIDCAKRLKVSTRKLDHGKMLYDENGLPK
jgi:antitoxin VapB